MRIVEDKCNRVDQHEIKNRWWKLNGIEVLRYPLPVGDYILVTDRVQDVINRKQKRNVEIKKMDFMGSYNVCVDTKKDIQELIGDICGKQHERFRDECMLAQNNGIKLYILVENNSIVINERKGIYSPFIDSLDNLHRFVNPRLFIWRNGKQKYPTATKGVTLKKACITMRAKYGVEFLFCRPNESAKIIVDLLTTPYDSTRIDTDFLEKSKYGREIG